MIPNRRATSLPPATEWSDSHTREIGESLALVYDGGDPVYVIVDRDPCRTWTAESIVCAVRKKTGRDIELDTTRWHHARHWSTCPVHEVGGPVTARSYLENTMRHHANLRGPFYVAPRGHFHGGSKLRPFSTLSDALEHGQNLGKPFDVHNDAGAVVWSYDMRKNGDVVDAGWRFRKTGYDRTWGPVPDMRTEGPVGKPGTVYEFNIKLRGLRGVKISDEELYVESELAVRGLSETLQESYPWISEVYQTGRSGGWLAIKDRDGKARDQSLREIGKFIQEERESFEQDLRERYGAEGHRENAAGYYVWPLNPKTTTPLSTEGPFGPYPLANAKTTARIRATEGKHDYAVTRGNAPERLEVQAIYEHGTGRNLTR